MDSRIIELTKADITNNKLNIRPCGEEFFPKDTFGGPSEKFRDIDKSVYGQKR
jgi:hypothetical protein